MPPADPSPVVIYQAFLGEEQRAHLDPSSLPLDIGSRTPNHQREYELFKLVMRHRKSDISPWGVLSWKFQQKAQISVNQFKQFAHEKFKSGYDCVFVNPMIGQEAVFINVWEQGQVSHPGMRTIAKFLESQGRIHPSVAMLRESFTFCNYFVATPRFWTSYFDFSDRAISLLESEARQDSEVGTIYSGSANYVKDPELTMRPFILERMLSSFLITQRIFKVAAFPWELIHFEERFGRLLGQILWNLSALKREAFELERADLKDKWGSMRRALFFDNMARNLIIGHEDPPSVMFAP